MPSIKTQVIVDESHPELLAELEHDPFAIVTATKQPLAITMDDRLGRDHLGIEPGRRAENSVEASAGGIGPVHHRRHRPPGR